MPRLTLLAFAPLLAGLPAVADESWDVWETGWTAEASTVVAPGAEDVLLYRLALGFDANRVLENGVELGLAMQVDAAKDQGARSGFSGILADPVPGMPSYSGAFSGLGRSPDTENDGTRGVLQTAYVYASGGYGEVRLGRDEGVAKRFAQGAPSVFSNLSLHAPRLDPDGGAIVRTDHDLTGPAAKISYTTPRIVGLRGGVSFTPEADVRGLDRDPARSLPGMPAFSLQNAAEASLSFSHLFRSSGIRVRASTGWSRAEVEAAPTSPVAYGDVETWSAGASVEWKETVIGASWLGSDNGLEGVPGDYSAWTLGITHRAFGLDWGAEYGEAIDDAAAAEGESWRAGVAQNINDNARISLGYRSDTLDLVPQMPVRTAGGDGIVLEITLSR